MTLSDTQHRAIGEMCLARSASPSPSANLRIPSVSNRSIRQSSSRSRPDPLVEVQRRFVPLQRAPFEPGVTALLGASGQVLHHRQADAAAAVLGPHVDVLEPDARAALEGREVGEEDRVADRFSVGRLDQERLGGRAARTASGAGPRRRRRPPCRVSRRPPARGSGRRAAHVRFGRGADLDVVGAGHRHAA